MVRCKRLTSTWVRLLRRGSPQPCGDTPIALTCEFDPSIRSPPTYPGSISSENSDDELKKDPSGSIYSRSLRRPSRRRLISLLRESKASLKHNLSETTFGLKSGLFLLALYASKASSYILGAVKFLAAVVGCMFAAPVLILLSTARRYTRKEARIYIEEDLYYVL